MGPPEGKHLQKVVPVKSMPSVLESPHNSLSVRRPQGNALEKAGPSRTSQEPCSGPSRTSQEPRSGPSRTSQEPHSGPGRTSQDQHSGPSRTSQNPHSGPSRIFQEPRSASEPPKVLNREIIHPRTRSTKSSEDSTKAARAATENKYPKESRALYPAREVSKRQAAKTSLHFLSDHLSQTDIAEIERQTLGQRENQEWYYWRQNRVTASLAHQISHSRFANKKTNDIPQSYLKSILGSAPRVQTAAMSWGIRNEKKAVNAYERLASISKGREVLVEPCGLFIHPVTNWLAASPDGIVKDRRTGETLNILEVKCPFKHREHNIHEACKDRDFCLTSNGDSYSLKQKHAYYTQVQCQMAVTGIHIVDFVVYTKKETVVIPVKFDLEFWKVIEPKLEIFYREAVLPNVNQGGTYKEDVENKGVYTPEE